MSKYIDAEKLITYIERFRATEYDGNTLGDDVANGALDYVLEEIIPSLLQEQPQVADASKMEQQEVNLEKEIDREWEKCNPTDEGMGVETANIHIEAFDMITRHFYELGLEAGKKE